MKKIKGYEIIIFTSAIILLISYVWVKEFFDLSYFFVEKLNVDSIIIENIMKSTFLLLILTFYIVVYKHYKNSMSEKDILLQSLFNNTADSILIVENSKIVNCNNNSIILLKATTKNQIIGKNIYDFISTNLVSFDSSKSSETKLSSITNLDDSTNELIITISNFNFKKNKFTQILIHNDSLINSIYKLRENQENTITSISKLSNTGLFCWDSSCDLFTYNETFSNITGFTGSKFSEFIESPKLHPNDYLPLKRWFEQCLDVKNCEFIFKFKWKNNEEFWQKYLLKSNTVLENNNVKLFGIITIFNVEDDTETENLLLENNAKAGSFKYDFNNKIFFDISSKAKDILNLSPNETTLNIDELYSRININEFNNTYFEHKNLNNDTLSERIFSITSTGLKVKTIVSSNKNNNKYYDYGLIIDINDSWQKENELYKTSFAVDKSPEEIFFTDLSGNIIYANKVARKSFGISYADYNKKTIMDFNNKIDTKWWLQVFIPQLKINQKYSYETYIKTSLNIENKFVEVQNNLISYNDQEYICSFVRDISSRAKFENELKFIATHDQLSQILNRNGVYENMQNIFNSEKFAVIMIDLDDFKPVNDTYGHEAGDLVISTLAKRLKTNSPFNSIVGRLSGDEFIVIIPNYGDMENLDEIIRKIYTSITYKYIISQGVCKIDASMGISLYPENGSSRSELFRKADKAMYSVKTNGKGGYTLYSNLL